MSENKIKNDNKICFIMCTNHELYEKECMYYIQRLHVPKGYEVEVLTIREAASMTAGYNCAMQQSNAKYKVYLHQDVFIINEQFLSEILQIFLDVKVGMIGIVGSLNIEESSVMWYSDRVGMLHSNSVYKADSYLFGKVSGTYQEVSAVDGLLMATQYDIQWREDLFKNWDFYDLSQSMEFRKRGFKIVVPFTEKPWCIHDDGILTLGNYYKERDVYLKEYGGI